MAKVVSYWITLFEFWIRVYYTNKIMIINRSSFINILSHFLLVLNSSTNILIYLWKDKMFWKILKPKLENTKVALIPFLLLVILKSLTFQVIRMSTKHNPRTTKRQQRDQGIARMFVFIVSVFFFCNTPRIVLNTFEVSLSCDEIGFWIILDCFSWNTELLYTIYTILCTLWDCIFFWFLYI